ncbi:NAD(P)/FAD-dependent oxidoreductase [Actinokineospora sp. HUAS TT18]|uniref:NAD(P)/FAD-dependent oxidoreductase n=1 Tax=Actinokineospora sp. HUAS TT18 TaxID=3447451 RepID=UPI003F51E487
MPDVLIVGGGFAGVWAAMAAARLRGDRALDIALVDPGDAMVVRPRLYQPDPGSMRVPYDRVLRPIGVERITGRAVAIDTDARTVKVDGGDLPYRRLVLAAGSALRRPKLPGAEHLHDVDSLAGAVKLDQHLRQAGQSTAVVVGAGFTGLEVATELADRARVVLVQRAESVSPELGPGPRPAILAALRTLGIEVRLNVEVNAVTATGAWLSDGTAVPARTVVWTAGVAASPLTRQVPGRRDHLGRLHVDEHLRVPEAPDVFAAGDTAAADAGGELTMPSCQHAIPLGRHAGHNAVADLLGLPARAFSPEPYVTCLDLGSAGAVFTTGFERSVRATGDQAKVIKRAINEVTIYPPTDDATTILAEGDPTRTWADMRRSA